MSKKEKRAKVSCESCRINGLICDYLLPSCSHCTTDCSYDSSNRLNALQSKIDQNLSHMETVVTATSSTKKKQKASHFENNLPHSNLSTTIIRPVEASDAVILNDFFTEIYVTLVLMHIPGSEKFWRHSFGRSWLLLNAITAITTPYIDLKPGEKRNNALGMPFYTQAELAWTTQIETDPIVSCFALLLMARYALASGIVRSGLLYLTSAYQVARQAGFNNETSLSTHPPFLKELAKRLWMTLVSHDVLTSSTNGRNLICSEQESELTLPTSFSGSRPDGLTTQMQILLNSSTDIFIMVPKNASLESFFWLMAKVMHRVTVQEFSAKSPSKTYAFLLIERCLRHFLTELNANYPLEIESSPFHNSLNILIRLVIQKCFIITWLDTVLESLEADATYMIQTDMFAQFTEAIDLTIHLLNQYQKFHPDFHRGHALVGLTIFNHATGCMKVSKLVHSSLRNDFIKRFNVLYSMMKVYSNRYEVTELMIVLDCLAP